MKSHGEVDVRRQGGKQRAGARAGAERMSSSRFGRVQKPSFNGQKSF